MSEMKAYWHIHHSGKILEFSDCIEERIKYIKENKPISEIETRLKWMTPVKGELPIEVVETWKVCYEARKVYDEAWKACYEASKVYVEAWNASYEAWKAYDEARRAYDEALAKHSAEIVDLHRIEHPNCPWDYERKTLVFN